MTPLLKKVTPEFIKKEVRKLKLQRQLNSRVLWERTLAQARLNSKNAEDAGFVTSINSADYYYPDRSSFEYLVREFLVRETLNFRSDRENPNIIDCGANIGISTIFFKSIFPSATVTAFEPDPDLFRYLTKNCASLDGVELIEAAVWTEETTLPFQRAGLLGSHFSHLSEKPGPGAEIEVKTARLSSYLESPVDLLKIDIEGAEFEVLKDCREFLSNVKNLFVEAHTFPDRPQRLAELFTLIEESGFRVHIHSSMEESQPFLSVSEHNGKDLRLNLFCYRPN